MKLVIDNMIIHKLIFVIILGLGILGFCVGCETTHTTVRVSGPPAPELDPCERPYEIALPKILVTDQVIGPSPEDYELLILAINKIRDFGESCFHINRNNMEKVATWVEKRKELQETTTSRRIDQDTVKSVTSAAALTGILTR